MQKQGNKLELTVYLVLWVALFVAPLLVTYFQSVHDTATAFSWSSVFFVWRQMGVFFVAFLLHNFLLAPLLVYRHRHALYFSLIVVLLGAFVLVQCAHRPTHHRPFGHHPSPLSHRPSPFATHSDHPLPPDTAAFMPPDGFREAEPPHFRDHEREHPRIMGEHDLIATIILVLMLGMNIGVKLYFKQRNDRDEMAEMERRNLAQQLEFLKYQINPHFMMNTLNNIHALVDIDPEEAKQTIVELSKIMRFVLYDGAKQLVPLSRELMFVENYVRLMWKRVADQVDIALDLPTQVPEYDIPPLLLITFVENAFKHGVSYQQESFIDISVKVSDSRLCFTCRNSKAPRNDNPGNTGGVGLANARQRMDLIYGDTYILDIADADSTYSVSLELPLSNNT